MKPIHWIIGLVITATVTLVSIGLSIDDKAAISPRTTPPDKAACISQTESAVQHWNSMIREHGYYSPAADQHQQGLVPACAGLDSADRIDVINTVGHDWGSGYTVAIWQAVNGQS